MKWAMKVIRFFKSRTRLVAWWFLLNQNFVKKVFNVGCYLFM